MSEEINGEAIRRKFYSHPISDLRKEEREMWQSDYTQIAENLTAMINLPNTPPVQEEIFVLAQKLMRVVYRSRESSANKPGYGGYMDDDYELIGSLGKLHQAIKIGLDHPRFLEYAETGVRNILKFRHQIYWSGVNHILDNVNFPEELKREIESNLIISIRDNEQFKSDDNWFGKLFHYGRTKDEGVVYFIKKYGLQERFLPWTKERFVYYEEEGNNEPAAVIGSLGGVEKSLWEPPALKRIISLFRLTEGRGIMQDWYIDNLIKYVKPFIEYIEFPKSELINLAKKEIPGNRRNRLEFINWLKS